MYMYNQTEFPGTQKNFSTHLLTASLHTNFQILPNLPFCEQQASVCEHGHAFSVLYSV